jgi:small Trp-rich protein
LYTKTARREVNRPSNEVTQLSEAATTAAGLSSAHTGDENAPTGGEGAMLFLIVGVLLVGLKLAEVGATAAWPWWVVLAPFGLAIVWWWYADRSGLNKRREMARMDDRKAQRRQSALQRLGLGYLGLDKAERRARRFQSARQRQIDKVEGKRAAQRARNRDSILGSRFNSDQHSTHDTKQ